MQLAPYAIEMSKVNICNSDITGDSIVVAPSQTLSNEEYHMLRETALKVNLMFCFFCLAYGTNVRCGTCVFFLYLYLCYKCHCVRWCAILALWENATSSMPCIHSLWSTASLRSMLDSHAALLLLQKPQGKQTFKIFIFIINLSRSDFSNRYYNSPTMIRKSRSYSEP